jgi:hypothetical protein
MSDVTVNSLPSNPAKIRATSIDSNVFNDPANSCMHCLRIFESMKPGSGEQLTTTLSDQVNNSDDLRELLYDTTCKTRIV